MITFKTTLGDIKINLDFDKAPITAENFKKYAQDGFYNGTIFHRVIKGFMAQGGGFASIGATTKLGVAMGSLPVIIGVGAAVALGVGAM